jgi:hypothetical protein
MCEVRRVSIIMTLSNIPEAVELILTMMFSNCHYFTPSLLGKTIPFSNIFSSTVHFIRRLNRTGVLSNGV